MAETNTLTIEYPAEVLWAMQQNPDEFAQEARLLLALKLYETGKLSTGLAAQLADMPRAAFIYKLGQYGLSAFGETAEELASDQQQALQASDPTSHSE